MANAQVELNAAVPVDQVWKFVAEMNNWAPLMPGYEAHTESDDRNSIWKIRGDVGPFSRVVDFAVTIDEWEPPCPSARVKFSLKGLNEFVDGAGEFRIEANDGQGDTETSDVPAKSGLISRLYLLLYRLFSPLKVSGPIAPTLSGEVRITARSRIFLRLELNPRGPMGIVVDQLIAPLLRHEAEEFGNRIIGHLAPS
jgi:carbon monoxide dehydrogenase subunit G